MIVRLVPLVVDNRVACFPNLDVADRILSFVRNNVSIAEVVFIFINNRPILVLLFDEIECTVKLLWVRAVNVRSHHLIVVQPTWGVSVLQVGFV